MIFCNKGNRKVNPSVKIYIDNILIEQVTETKFETKQNKQKLKI